jgi:hypothetical protein
MDGQISEIDTVASEEQDLEEEDDDVETEEEVVAIIGMETPEETEGKETKENDPQEEGKGLEVTTTEDNLGTDLELVKKGETDNLKAKSRVSSVEVSEEEDPEVSESEKISELDPGPKNRSCGVG